jgi:hypothetical protein
VDQSSLLILCIPNDELLSVYLNFHLGTLLCNLLLKFKLFLPQPTQVICNHSVFVLQELIQASLRLEGGVSFRLVSHFTPMPFLLL